MNTTWSIYDGSVSGKGCLMYVLYCVGIGGGWCIATQTCVSNKTLQCRNTGYWADDTLDLDRGIDHVIVIKTLINVFI
jgi:hypothetical protein